MMGALIASMTAAIIDGKAFADGLRARLAEIVPDFVAKAGRKPGLAVVLVGDDPASAVYVGSKGKATRPPAWRASSIACPRPRRRTRSRRCSPAQRR
jgi:5,10-methylene-tetrahydrofolate dehydrogenase/methenyl tetrahydrofolate cyclohydrolase